MDPCYDRRYLSSIRRADTLARFLGLHTEDPLPELQMCLSDVTDGRASAIMTEQRLIGVIELDVTDGRIDAVHLVVNPDELGFIAPA